MSDGRSIPAPRTFRPPQAGEQIPHGGQTFTIGQRIGGGAFGAVYECSDEWRNELVAKVVVPGDRTYEQVRDEWDRELSNLVLLRHPNITFIHDAFEYRDTFYLIVECCTWTLREVVQQSSRPAREWISHVARDLLNGLHFMHRQGYVHKDLHAENVFVSQICDRIDPNQWIVQFKIGDLGISRLESDIRMFGTVLAAWMLPPEYLAPDEFGSVGRTTDIYHIGLLLLSLELNRQPTFTPEEILAGQPRQLAESLNSPYAQAIAGALRRHVAHRTQTPLELWKQIASATSPRQ